MILNEFDHKINRNITKLLQILYNMLFWNLIFKFGIKHMPKINALCLCGMMFAMKKSNEQHGLNIISIITESEIYIIVKYRIYRSIITLHFGVVNTYFSTDCFYMLIVQIIFISKSFFCSHECLIINFI